MLLPLRRACPRAMANKALERMRGSRGLGQRFRIVVRKFCCRHFRVVAAASLTFSFGFPTQRNATAFECATCVPSKGRWGTLIITDPNQASAGNGAVTPSLHADRRGRAVPGQHR